MTANPQPATDHLDEIEHAISSIRQRVNQPHRYQLGDLVDDAVALLASVDVVVKEHQPTQAGFCASCRPVEVYPCPTIRLVWLNLRPVRLVARDG